MSKILKNKEDISGWAQYLAMSFESPETGSMAITLSFYSCFNESTGLALAALMVL